MGRVVLGTSVCYVSGERLVVGSSAGWVGGWEGGGGGIGQLQTSRVAVYTGVADGALEVESQNEMKKGDPFEVPNR